MPRDAVRALARRAELRVKSEGPVLAVNRWPGGRRVVTCLRCERPMVSTSKGERLHPACRREEES